MNMNTLGLDTMTDTESDIHDQVSSVQNHAGYIDTCKLTEAIRLKTAIISHGGSQLLSNVGEIQNILRERFDNQGLNIFYTHAGNKVCFDKSLSQAPGLGSFCP